MTNQQIYAQILAKLPPLIKGITEITGLVAQLQYMPSIVPYPRRKHHLRYARQPLRLRR